MDYLNIKGKTTKLLDQNIMQYFYKLGIGKYILNRAKYSNQNRIDLINWIILHFFGSIRQSKESGGKKPQNKQK